MAQFHECGSEGLGLVWLMNRWLWEIHWGNKTLHQFSQRIFPDKRKGITLLLNLNSVSKFYE